LSENPILIRFPSENLTDQDGKMRKRRDAPPAVDPMIAARKFRDSLEPIPDADCGWVWDYGRDLFDRYTKIYKELDDKASDIIKYLGGGTGLFTLAALSNVTAKNIHILGWAIPSFLAALVSIFFASLARKPGDVMMPSTIENALDYARDYPESMQAKTVFLGCMHVSCTSYEGALARKAFRVEVATWVFFAAIAMLIIPILVAICSKATS
jgi:hypothetical protein